MPLAPASKISGLGVRREGGKLFTEAFSISLATRASLASDSKAKGWLEPQVGNRNRLSQTVSALPWGCEGRIILGF